MDLLITNNVKTLTVEADTDLSFLKSDKYRNLTELHIKGRPTQITQKHMDVLGSLTSLKRLTILANYVLDNYEGEEISHDALHLNICPSLEYLKITGYVFTQTSTTPISTVQTLILDCYIRIMFCIPRHRSRPGN
jgi:hypothetical protein